MHASWHRLFHAAEEHGRPRGDRCGRSRSSLTVPASFPQRVRAELHARANDLLNMIFHLTMSQLAAASGAAVGTAAVSQQLAAPLASSPQLAMDVQLLSPAVAAAAGSKMKGNGSPLTEEGAKAPPRAG